MPVPYKVAPLPRDHYLQTRSTLSAAIFLPLFATLPPFLSSLRADRLVRRRFRLDSVHGRRALLAGPAGRADAAPRGGRRRSGPPLPGQHLLLARVRVPPQGGGAQAGHQVPQVRIAGHIPSELHAFGSLKLNSSAFIHTPSRNRTPSNPNTQRLATCVLYVTNAR